MRITVFGAAGQVGSRLVAEGLSRGHEVTAVVRDAARFGELPAGAEARVGDAAKVADVAELSAGRDVVSGEPDRARRRRSHRGRRPEARSRRVAAHGAGIRRTARGVARRHRGGLGLPEPRRAPRAGGRTGTYRLGGDELLVDAEGNSTISREDLAVALLDEAERPRHHRARFTVAY
jgi:uncharacterized protein